MSSDPWQEAARKWIKANACETFWDDGVGLSEFAKLAVRVTREMACKAVCDMCGCTTHSECRDVELKNCAWEHDGGFACRASAIRNLTDEQILQAMEIESQKVSTK